MLEMDKESYVSKREKILGHLLLNRSNSGECCSLKDIASALGLSINAVRHYLVMLENEGLIFRTEKHGKIGRPAMLYSLHENAFEIFPKTYTEFSLSLLNEIHKRYGKEDLTDILKDIGKENAEKMLKRMTDNLDKETSFDTQRQKLESIVGVFRERGVFPELLEDESSFVIKNYNCLLYNVVKEEPLVCKVHDTIMDELVGYETAKEKCIVDGDECCTYRIKKN